jgi:(p)ppGpp synthase/HD superfamily hydrolase
LTTGHPSARPPDPDRRAGEERLRSLFAAEIAALPSGGRRTLERALALATEVHLGQRRAREPYLNHVLRVAIRIIREYRIADTEVLAAALLHDSVEDQPERLAGGADSRQPRTAALSRLAADFGARTAQLVAAVTNPEYSPGRGHDEQYLEHLVESLARDPWARVIKASDFTDNGVGITQLEGGRAARLARKYRPLVPVLRELLARPDTPLDASTKRRINAQLDVAEEELLAILGGPAGR